MVTANRAIKRLLQFDDAELLKTLSEGLDLIIKTALQHEAASRHLAGSELTDGFPIIEGPHQNAANILMNAAEEEAAKFMILIDFVRCPKVLTKQRDRQLNYFYNHLAKGLYIELSDHEFSCFDELISYCNIQRRQFYLDGDYEQYIFYNDILSKREDSLYVNYKWYGDLNYSWEGPTQSTLFSVDNSMAVRKAQVLYDIGVTKEDGLLVLSHTWQCLHVMNGTTRWDIKGKTDYMLEMLDKRNLINKDKIDDLRYLYNWFPLYNCDLTLLKVPNIQEIKEATESAILANEIGEW